MVKLLLEAQQHVTTLDDLSCGRRDAVVGGSFINLSLADRVGIRQVFCAHPFDAVMHFASFIQVAESVADPGKYYRNNVANTLNLLDAMVEHRVLSFVFSSTAAIYGEPRYVPIDEEHPKQPTNPYGHSKWMVERILADYDRAHGIKSVCLRYFNAAGADPEGALGECHIPETHLIPLVLQAASGRREHVSVFGRDYDTPDGTCIRDYIHVQDLCHAHLLALRRLMAGRTSDAFNLGNGNGFSVQEVIQTACRITGVNIPVRDGQRREGDPARLIADCSRAKSLLQWNPRFAELETIIAHAWSWEQKIAKVSIPG